MRLMKRVLAASLVMTLAAGSAYAAGNYRETIDMFKNSGASAEFFGKSYGYAVFPTVGEGGLVVGGAHGKGRVYLHGKWDGNVTITQVSVGLQAGGKAFSQIIFFEDKRAFDEFRSGSFEFGADASVVAITAAASASAGTDGADSAASGGKNDATTRGHYVKGMVTFVIAKGGLMGQAAVGGEKFKFSPKDES
jgi:lipid-binding SYLF domain-containing protein